MNRSEVSPNWHPICRRILPVLAAVLLCLYGAFRSVSLDDFDSYSFALALDRFDLASQQPQPPGFPVYIFLGRCLRAFTGDAVSALTWLSVLSGALAALAVFAIGVAIASSSGKQAASSGFCAALLASLLVALVPMGWLTACKALSDSLGLAMILLALWLLLTRKRPVGLALGGLVAGLALGVRPQNALPLGLLSIVYGVQVATKSRPFWHLLLVAGGAAVGTLVWLWPTALADGGLPAYIAHVQAHAEHVRAADSLWGMNLPPDAALWARARAFGDTFLSATVGLGVFLPWDLAGWICALLWAAFVAVGLARAGWRRWETWGLAAWTLATVAQVFFLENLDRPRLMLPILPPLALLVAQGWAHVTRPRWLAPATLAVVATALLAQGAPLAAQLATIPSPPAQATAYVLAHYPPGTTLIATAGSFRAVQVELPDYRQAYLYRFDPQAVRDAHVAGLRYVVIFDRDQFTSDALDVLSDGGRLVTLEERMFVRDRRVHTQHDQVRVQVLTPADLIPPEALALPADGCLDIGGDDDGRYLGTGWFRPEDVGGTRGRWAGETVAATVRLVLPQAGAYTVTLRALAYPAGQTLSLQAGTQSTKPVALSQGWAEVVFTLPGAWVSSGDGGTPGAVTTLTLVHAVAQSPFEVNGSSDTRALTAAYDWICVAPSP
ncbi:MAG: DUF2723 domain-containing protein [Anaerolineae bacterium]|nr:DUF2723 domain-containing protein [Anaerolineae bacterium]